MESKTENFKTPFSTSVSTPKGRKIKRYQANQYILCVLYDGGHRRVFSPDFGFYLTVPASQDSHRWTSLTLQQAEVEIESRLQLLDKENQEHPTPRRWNEVVPRTPKDLLSIRAAAKFMGLSESTLRRLVEAGKIRSWDTPGGHRRFSQSDLEKYLLKTAPSDPQEPSDSSSETFRDSEF